MKERAAIYLGREGRDAVSAEAVSKAEEFALANGFDVVGVFQESGYKKTQRRIGFAGYDGADPDHFVQLNALKRMAEEGSVDVDVVIMPTLRVIGRSVYFHINQALYFHRIGVRLISMNEPWFDLTGSNREVILQVLTWVIEKENQRITKSRADMRTLNQRMGRRRSAVDVGKVLQHRNQGASTKKIAKLMDLKKTVVERIFLEESIKIDVLGIQMTIQEMAGISELPAAKVHTRLTAEWSPIDAMNPGPFKCPHCKKLRLFAQHNDLVAHHREAHREWIKNDGKQCRIRGCIGFPELPGE